MSSENDSNKNKLDTPQKDFGVNQNPSNLRAQLLDTIKAPYLSGLNERQITGVTTLDGPVLMLAGAGTGKTRALTARIAHILNTKAAMPNQILAVTFTNKAAREMRSRIGSFVGAAVEGMPWLGTFHAICVKILRLHSELVGLNSNFTILDTDDQIRLLKQLIKSENIDEKKWTPRYLASIIESWKNRALTPSKIPISEVSVFDGNGSKLYDLYQQRLKLLNATDFGDLLLHTLTIFQENDDILQKFQLRFKFILVDEYQDTNVAQYLWLRMLAQLNKNICCVGDDDQSIYGWRGAEVGNILRFEKDFKHSTIIKLEQNYRSTPHILNAASNLISANRDRLSKTLWTNHKSGAKIRLTGHWDDDDEARWITDEVEAFEKGTRGLDPVPLSKQAILVRASFQMRAFEDRFIAVGLPYRVVGGPRFYERLEIKDAISYFRIAQSPSDSLAFERIINTPKRGIGEKTQQAIIKLARTNNSSLLDAARNFVSVGGVSEKISFELKNLINMIDHWRNQLLNSNLPHFEVAARILDESGYTEMWQNDKSPNAPGRLENLKELIKALEDFENLHGFLEHISLIMDNDKEDNSEKISLMTLHAAKGLEFMSVFLPGWEEGLFPSQRSMDDNGSRGLEEERRLAYVGITRAEKYCTISFAANRRIYNQWQSAIPSRFIDNLSKTDVEVITAPAIQNGIYGAASTAHIVGEPPGDLALVNEENNHPNSGVYESPGWKRMKENASRISSNNRLHPTSRKSTLQDTLEIGEKVFHQKFGYGYVLLIEDDIVTVSFKKSEEKKVKACFLFSKDKMP